MCSPNLTLAFEYTPKNTWASPWPVPRIGRPVLLLTGRSAATLGHDWAACGGTHRGARSARAAQMVTPSIDPLGLNIFGKYLKWMETIETEDFSLPGLGLNIGPRSTDGVSRKWSQWLNPAYMTTFDTRRCKPETWAEASSGSWVAVGGDANADTCILHTSNCSKHRGKNSLTTYWCFWFGEGCFFTALKLIETQGISRHSSFVKFSFMDDLIECRGKKNGKNQVSITWPTTRSTVRESGHVAVWWPFFPSAYESERNVHIAFG